MLRGTDFIARRRCYLWQSGVSISLASAPRETVETRDHPLYSQRMSFLHAPVKLNPDSVLRV